MINKHNIRIMAWYGLRKRRDIIHPSIDLLRSKILHILLLHRHLHIYLLTCLLCLLVMFTDWKISELILCDVMWGMINITDATHTQKARTPIFRELEAFCVLMVGFSAGRYMFVCYVNQWVTINAYNSVWIWLAYPTSLSILFINLSPEKKKENIYIIIPRYLYLTHPSPPTNSHTSWSMITIGIGING